MSEETDTRNPVSCRKSRNGPPNGSRASTKLAVKEAISLAAEGMGGVDALVKWARRSKENERIFWTILYPKLLPLEVEGEVEMGKRLAVVAAK